MVSCCNLVGNFDVDSSLGIISVTSQGSTPVSLISAGGSSAVTVAPSTGTVSITAYAGERYYGCPGRAGVTIPWVVKSDCGENRYLFGGAGKSYISGGSDDYVSFPVIDGISNPVASYNVISASASSGPGALYENSVQQDGYGLVYTGAPFSEIDTSDEEQCFVNLTSYGIGEYGDCKLQNLNIQFVPGQVPVVNMSFIYTVEVD